VSLYRISKNTKIQDVSLKTCKDSKNYKVRIQASLKDLLIELNLNKKRQKGRNDGLQIAKKKLVFFKHSRNVLKMSIYPLNILRMSPEYILDKAIGKSNKE